MGDALTWSSFRDYFETFSDALVLGLSPWDDAVFVPESGRERVLLRDSSVFVPGGPHSIAGAHP